VEGHSERTATLSDSARQVLNDVSEDGSENERDNEVTQEDLQERVQDLERRLDVLVATQSCDELRERIDRLEDGLERTADEVAWHDTIADALWTHHSDSDDREFHGALDDLVNSDE
jgi:chromosome segregation ATPase